MVAGGISNFSIGLPNNFDINIVKERREKAKETIWTEEGNPRRVVSVRNCSLCLQEIYGRRFKTNGKIVFEIFKAAFSIQCVRFLHLIYFAASSL